MRNKRLKRDSSNGIFMGVCAGIGNHFNIDPTWIRIGTLGLVLALPYVGAAYLILGFILPSE